MNFLILILATIGAHRIWNYEAIFEPIRRRLLPLNFRPLTCPACNAFWIALGIVALHLVTDHVVVGLLLMSLAIYPFARTAVWLYTNSSSIITRLAPPIRVEQPTPQQQVVAPELVPEIATTVKAVEAAQSALSKRRKLGDVLTVPFAAPTTPPCGTCAEKKTALIEQQKEALSYDRRVVLLTALSYFPSSYSLVSVIFDQARMLARDPKTLVQVWVMEGTDVRKAPVDLPDNVKVRAIIPGVSWKEDIVDEPASERLATSVRESLMALGNATIITHDLLFITHYLTFAAAIHRIASVAAFRWFHVCHSAAAPTRPTGQALALRATLPPNHRLLCLNAKDREHLAAYYGVGLDRVLVVPNARDITSFGKMEPHAAALIRKHQLALADVVQVFPVSGTRMEAKGVSTLITLFGAIARLGHQTKLVLVNAHSNSEPVERQLESYKLAAVRSGLGGDNLIITSHEFQGSKADGLPEQAVRDLFSVSNLFVLPSLSEASSLVLVEAAISGCLLVTNSSLHTLDGYTLPALTAAFGSVRDPGNRVDPDALAALICERLANDAINRSKRDALRRYSHTVIGDQLLAAIDAPAPTDDRR